jgi:hypothetical protein
MMELITDEDDGDLSASLQMLEPGDGLTTSSNIHKCNLKLKILMHDMLSSFV